MPGATITVRGLSHRYGTGSKQLGVLEGLDLDVAAGGYVAVTGASGAGKSTLLSVLGGLDAPQQGEVVVGGHDLHALSRNRLADFRRDTVGFVFQHFGLLDTLTALENVALANALTGERAAVGRAKAHALLAAVGLAGRADHAPAALSGGERQRVAIARALVNEPRLVLADEPTGNLDDDSTEVVVELLESLPAERGCTLVLVTHDRRLAARAEQRFRLVGGRLVGDQVGAGAVVGGPVDPDPIVGDPVDAGTVGGGHGGGGVEPRRGRPPTAPPDRDGRGTTAPPDEDGRGTTAPPDRDERGTTAPPDGDDRGTTAPPAGDGRGTTAPPDGDGRGTTVPPDGDGRGTAGRPDGAGPEAVADDLPTPGDGSPA